jgi:hypothetical protein
MVVIKETNFADPVKFLRTAEIMQEIREEGEAGSENRHCIAGRPTGVQGEQVILLFILCVMRLTIRWGGLTALKIIAQRVEIPKEPQDGIWTSLPRWTD